MGEGMTLSSRYSSSGLIYEVARVMAGGKSSNAFFSLQDTATHGDTRKNLIITSVVQSRCGRVRGREPSFPERLFQASDLFGARSFEDSGLDTLAFLRSHESAGFASW